MATEPQLQPSTEASESASPVELTQSVTKEPNKGALATLKKWAWRLTAGLVWVKLVVSGFLGSSVISNLEHGFGNSVVIFLSAVGFAPVNADYLGPLSKGAWFLIITGFSAAELLGLSIYIISFPLVLVGFLLVKFFEDTIDKTATSEDQRPGLIKKPSDFPVGSVLICSFLAWGILYGSATNRRPVLVGVVLAGGVFAVFIYRAFRKARPAAESETRPLEKLENIGARMVKVFFDGDRKQLPSKQAEAQLAIKITSAVHRFYRRLSVLARGRRGRDRVSLMVLFDYVLTLLFLGLSSVVFWALLVKAACAPAYVSSWSAFQYAGAHFMPGMKTPELITPPPSWIPVTISITAFILFVLYVGPASSLVPARQKTYASSLTTSYRNLAKITALLKKRITLMRSLKQKLPK
jgi:hypothetical protein